MFGDLHTKSSRADRNSAPTAGPTTLVSAPTICGSPPDRSIRPSLDDAEITVACHPLSPSPIPNARRALSGEKAYGSGGDPVDEASSATRRRIAPSGVPTQSPVSEGSSSLRPIAMRAPSAEITAPLISPRSSSFTSPVSGWTTKRLSLASGMTKVTRTVRPSLDAATAVDGPVGAPGGRATRAVATGAARPAFRSSTTRRNSSPAPRARYRNSTGTVVRVTWMVTAPTAPGVLGKGEADGVLAGVLAVEVGAAVRVAVGVGTTEDCGRPIATYATAATTIARISTASAAVRIQ